MSSASDMLRIGSSGFVSGFLQLAVLYEDPRLILKVWVDAWVQAHRSVQKKKNRFEVVSYMKK